MPLRFFYLDYILKKNAVKIYAIFLDLSFIPIRVHFSIGGMVLPKVGPKEATGLFVQPFVNIQ